MHGLMDDEHRFSAPIIFGDEEIAPLFRGEGNS